MDIDINDVELFPLDLPHTQRRIPTQQKNIAQIDDGNLARGQNWPTPLYRYELNFPVLDVDEQDKLERFWSAHEFNSEGIDFFLLKDFKYNRESGTVFSEGDPPNRIFRLKRDRSFGKRSFFELASWVESGTETIFIDGDPVDSALYTMDFTIGEVFFNSAPASGTELSASFNFFRKCIFDGNDLPQDFINDKFTDVSLRLREVR